MHATIYWSSWCNSSVVWPSIAMKKFLEITHSIQYVIRIIHLDKWKEVINNWTSHYSLQGFESKKTQRSPFKFKFYGILFYANFKIIKSAGKTLSLSELSILGPLLRTNGNIHQFFAVILPGNLLILARARTHYNLDPERILSDRILTSICSSKMSRRLLRGNYPVHWKGTIDRYDRLSSSSI